MAHNSFSVALLSRAVSQRCPWHRVTLACTDPSSSARPLSLWVLCLGDRIVGIRTCMGWWCPEPRAWTVARGFLHVLLREGSFCSLEMRLGCARASVAEGAVRKLGTVLCTQKSSQQRLCPGLALGSPPLSRERGVLRPHLWAPLAAAVGKGEVPRGEGVCSLCG